VAVVAIVAVTSLSGAVNVRLAVQKAEARKLYPDYLYSVSLWRCAQLCGAHLADIQMVVRISAGPD
jgi:hypothetical protein